MTNWKTGSRTYASPDERLQRDIDMVNAALVAERERIAAAVRGLRDGGQHADDRTQTILTAVLVIIEETP